MKAFYIASAAAVVTAAGIAQSEHIVEAAQPLQADANYAFLETAQNVVDIDLKNVSLQRIITFSAPVDEASLQGQIMLVDVTDNVEKNIVATVDSQNNHVVKVTLNNDTYAENHEYKLLIGNGIKSVVGTALKQATQFNFKTIHVAESNETLAGEATITENGLALDGATFTPTEELSVFFEEHAEAFAGADLEVRVSNNVVEAIEAVTLRKDGTAAQPVAIDASAGDLTEATITVAADHVQLKNGAVKEIVIDPNVTTPSEIENMTVDKIVAQSTNDTRVAMNSPKKSLRLENVDTKEVVLGSGESLSTYLANNIGTLRFTGSASAELFMGAGFVRNVIIEGATTTASIQGTFENIVVRTNQDTSILGNLAAETLTVETPVSVNVQAYESSSFQNMIEDLYVKHDATKIKLNGLLVHTVHTPANKRIEDVISNYHEVKEQIFAQPKLQVRELLPNLSGETFINASYGKDANLYHATYSYSDASTIPDVGDVLPLEAPNVRKLTIAQPVPAPEFEYNYVFNVDAKGKIIERVRLMQSYYVDYVQVRVITPKDGGPNILRIQVEANVEGMTPEQFFTSLYIADDQQGKMIDLSEYEFVVRNGIGHLDIPAKDGFTFKPGHTYFYIPSLKNPDAMEYFSKLPDITKEPKTFGRLLHSAAKEEKQSSIYERFVRSIRPISYTITNANGSTQQYQSSAIKGIPTVLEAYKDIFKNNVYTTKASMETAILNVEKQHAATIKEYEALLTQIESVYTATSTHLYQLTPYFKPVRSDVTVDTLLAIEKKINASTLAQQDKDVLLQMTTTLKSIVK